MSLLATLAVAGAIAGANYLTSKNTNKTNKTITNDNNATQIELANTAHQREVDDLKEAGLNPILSAGGQGSATPALQNPTLTAPQFNIDSIMNAVSTMGTYEKNRADATKTTVETELAPKIAQAQIEMQNAQGDLAKQKTIREKILKEIDEIQKKHYTDTGTAPNMSVGARELNEISNIFTKNFAEPISNSARKALEGLGAGRKEWNDYEKGIHHETHSGGKHSERPIHFYDEERKQRFILKDGKKHYLENLW